VAINVPDSLLHLASAAVTGYAAFMAERRSMQAAA
jgi:hypothetical protein